MILSFNLRTEHGTPGWLELDRNKKSPLITFLTKTNEKIDSFLGNVGHDNILPKGFAVKRSALKKEPFCFSPKTLYLNVDAIMVQSVNGEEYHQSVELNQSMVCRALVYKEEFYAYIIVEPAKDKRFKYWPVMISTEQRNNH